MNVQRYFVICNGATELEMDIAAAVLLEIIGELTMPSGTAMFQMVKPCGLLACHGSIVSHVLRRAVTVSHSGMRGHIEGAQMKPRPRLATREGAI
jgi:hypothetical protein